MTTTADGHSEMERGGYYNAHSRPQGSAGELGIPLFRRAAQEIPVSGDMLCICDLGAAQGKNSIEPLKAAIADLRARSQTVPIAVTHTDIPSNDFTSLFELLASDGSYLAGTTNVYAYAAGLSFYERLFPPNTQLLGWNAIAVHWLSSVPCSIPDHIWSPYAQGAVREAWRKRAADDWNNFLTSRAAEFRQGGQLVIVASSANDQGFPGAEGLMNMANDELRAMVRRRSTTGDRYDKMAIPTYYRTRAEFEAPFTADSPFELLESTPTVLQDPFWTAYEQSHDEQAFAAAYTSFFRAFSEPSLFGETQTPVANEFYAGVQQRIASNPAAAVCNWQLLLMRIKRKSLQPLHR